jgi:hypothetical protein
MDGKLLTFRLITNVLVLGHFTLMNSDHGFYTMDSIMADRALELVQAVLLACVWIWIMERCVSLLMIDHW